MWKTRLILGLLILFIMPIGAIYWLQDYLIYHPQPIDLAKALVVAKELRLTPWPDAVAPRGWLRETSATTRGTVLVFHKNTGNALSPDHWFPDGMEKRGYRTLLVEYPGFGHRGGLIDEESLTTDAAEDIAAVRKQFGGKLVVIGVSFGAGVASAALARDSIGVGAVMLITPWDKFVNVAKLQYPQLPTFLLRDRYDSVDNLKAFKGRKLVLIAGRDTVIPPELGRNLFNGLDEGKKLVDLPDADHYNWLSQMTPNIKSEVQGYLEGQ